MKVVDTVVNDVRTDANWNRVARLGARGIRALPSTSTQYAIEKVPIVSWLPRYNPRWLINDLIAGLTVGLMLIPQGLSYAKIATIPVQYGLMSSWLPAALYTVMGTTKDVSTGPTSLIGLLTSDNVKALSTEGYSPSEIASATAMMMGVYGMVLGFLKLGFLLEFISTPILSGFISAVAITIMLNQMDSLLGEDGVGDGAATQIHDIFHQLPTANVYACAIGFTGILFLTILEKSGKRWGHKNRVIWFLSITRAFLCLVLYTGISYAVNKSKGDSDNFLFEVAAVKSNGIETPRIPQSSLISKVAGRSIAVFIGAAVEHTAIARGFGVKNNYVCDQSQELTYFGITNFFNSFFHAMGVGGAMSRTAVNSSCNVKSPLSGAVTTAVVLISIYKLVGTLYWIPKATLAAIIICACWPLISPPSVFYKYWKTSLADWISSMIAFWVSLFVSTEAGIGASVGFNIVYIIIRQVFARVRAVGPESSSELIASIDSARGVPQTIPADVRVFRFNDSWFFPNAYAIKTKILDSVQTHHSPHYSSLHGSEAERNWSVVGEKRIARLRKRAQIVDPTALPALGLIVLDFDKVNHIDVTAVSNMANLMLELRKYAGKQVEVRFVAATEYVRERFERAGWTIIHVDQPHASGDENMSGTGVGAGDLTVRHYRSIASAISAPRRGDSAFIEEEMKKGLNEDEKMTYSHEEQV